MPFDVGRVTRRVSCLCPLLLASGCLGEAPSEPSTGRVELPVLDGFRSERESVVLIRSRGPDRTGLCTGTVVAPNLVVTARHCVSAFTDGDYTCTIEGDLDTTRSRVPANAGDMGAPYAPELVGIHTGQDPNFDVPAAVGVQIIAPETNTICRNDVAFVILDREVEVPWATVRLDRGVEPLETVTVIGYGINDERLTARYEASDKEIIALGPSEFHPIEGSALPRTFVLGRSVCPGDSGGPAISDATDELLGVFSLFRGECESSEVRNFFTQLAPYAEFAREAFRAAGHEEFLAEGDAPTSPSSDGGGGGALSLADDNGGSTESPGCAFAAPDAAASSWLPAGSLVVLVGARRRKRARRSRAGGSRSGMSRGRARKR